MFDPFELLNEQFDAEDATIDSAVQQQAQLLQGHRKRLLENMNQEYLIERKYIENTPMEREARGAKLGQLNKKYELRMSKMDQELEPHVLDLKQKQAAAKTKVASQRQEGQRRLTIVQGLVNKGLVVDQEAALQEQLQAVGISMPITSFRQPVRKMEDVRGELTEINRLFEAGYIRHNANRSMLDKEGRLRSNVKFSPTGAEQDARSATPLEIERGNDLLKMKAKLTEELDTLLLQNNVGPMQLAQREAARVQGNRFAKGVVDQLPKRKPEPVSGRIKVRNPSGKIGMISAVSLEEALAAGYTLVEE